MAGHGQAPQTNPYFGSFEPSHCRFKPDQVMAIGIPTAKTAQKVIKAVPGDMSRMTQTAQVQPLCPSRAFVQLEGGTYLDVVAIGELSAAAGRSRRGNYNVAHDDAAPCVLLFNLYTCEMLMVDDLEAAKLWLFNGPQALDTSRLKLLPTFLKDILAMTKGTITPEHVLRFCWHDVPRRHVLDSPTYKYQLSLYVKGVLVCAGSIFAYDSLLGAMVMDMLRQAGSGQPLNFRCYGLRWQVLHELQLMYKTTVPGLLLHQANKMKADKAKTFLGVMCEAGITGKVQELYPWAMEEYRAAGLPSPAGVPLMASMMQDYCNGQAQRSMVAAKLDASAATAAQVSALNSGGSSSSSAASGASSISISSSAGPMLGAACGLWALHWDCTLLGAAPAAPAAAGSDESLMMLCDVACEADDTLSEDASAEWMQFDECVW